MSEMKTLNTSLELIVGGAILFVAMRSALPSETQSHCMELKPRSSVVQHVLIEKPGCYVLAAPLAQERWFVLSEGGWRSSGVEAMIQTAGTDIDIDLAGFSLKSTAGVGGLVADAGRYEDRFVPLRPEEVHRVHIHNGTIDLTGSGGHSRPAVIAPNGLNSSEWNVHDLTLPRPLPTRFRKVEYVLENLTIRAPSEAAMLMGDGVVIRNCTIEVKAENALVIYGPNAIIENNRIVYRSNGGASKDRRRDSGHYPELRAAIYLRGANNAIVRGNNIDISRWDRPVSAVAVVESKDVLVEGNRFNTDVTPVVLSGASTATLKRNEVQGSFFNKSRMLPDTVMQ